MTLKEIGSAIKAVTLTKQPDFDTEITSAYAADMMSDVLASAGHGSILITGLLNLQVIRTAEMKDLTGVIFTSAKAPDNTIIQLANSYGLCVMATNLPTFAVCGLLYVKGIRDASEK